MTLPSHAAPDRSPAAGEETAGRSPRKRVTVITATALSRLEACGLGPSPSRPDKTAGKEGRAPQGDAPAGKVPADHPQARQAEEPASSRRRSGGRKTASAPDRAPRTVAGRPPEEEAPLTVAAGSVAVPEDLPVIPSEPATPPGPAAFPKKNAARRRRAGSPAAAPVTGTPTVPPPEAGGQAATPGAGPADGQPSVDAAAPVPGVEQTGAACRARRSSASGGRGRKKAAGMPPASAGETASAVAPAEEQAPGRPPDAAARAAEADRLAAEYGLSSSGGGLVVLPGDEDGDDFPAPRDDGAPDARAAARSVMTAPAAPGSRPVCPLPDGHDGAGKATPPAGAGMGRREAAFRQWAAAMQARFDAGLEAEEDRAARRQEALVVLPPPSGAGGRERRTAKKPQAATAEAPRPRAWVTRRRSTEPGHEARFGEWPGPARTGSVLEKVFISLGASPEQAKLSRLWRSWDAVLGPDLAPLARPLGHHDDKLLIGAEDAVLLQELYYMGPEIVRRANDFLQEDFFTAVKVSLMLDHQDLDAPSPVLERSAGRPQEELPAPSGASLGLMDPESAVARCYARFLGMELPDPRK